MGNVTNITHVAGKSPTTYAKGDMTFSIGTVIRSHRGWPFTVIETDRNDFLDDFGVPDRANEGGYQAKLALHNHQNTVGKYVRVVDADVAMYPYLTIAAADGAVATGAELFANGPVEADATHTVKAYVKNGETRDEFYGLQITKKDTSKATFVVTVFQNKQNPVQVGLPLTVSLDPLAVAADGSSLFIESVFLQKSSVIGFSCDASAELDHVLEMAEITWFTGGVDTPDALATADYTAAWDCLRNHQVELDQIFMAGDTDNIATAISVANERDIRLECDFQAGQSASIAANWLKSESFTSHNVSFTYGQVSFNDPFYAGLRATIRVSGLVTAAKAYAREASKTISDPSIEEAPAGENFGLLRGITGIRNETPLNAADKKALAEAWANYIVNSTDKGVIVWEQFTLYGEDTPYAYKRNVDVINYLYHTDAATMQKQQFRGKTDQEIISSLSKVRQRLAAKGVLVTDENDEEYPEAYRIWINRNGASVEINRAIRIQNAIGPIVMKTIPL